MISCNFKIQSSSNFSTALAEIKFTIIVQCWWKIMLVILTEYRKYIQLILARKWVIRTTIACLILNFISHNEHPLCFDLQLAACEEAFFYEEQNFLDRNFNTVGVAVHVKDKNGSPDSGVHSPSLLTLLSMDPHDLGGMVDTECLMKLSHVSVAADFCC